LMEEDDGQAPSLDEGSGVVDRVLGK
jgi:hypothetical protein